jgi:N-succinyldiaminopimelate aminotransferase
MLNPRLADLPGNMFAELRALLADLTPPAGLAPIDMGIGEPQDAPPPILIETVAAHPDSWGRYPPPLGLDDLRAASAEWLTRRYALPSGMIDPARHLLAVAGTKEALFLVATIAVGPDKAGQRPAVLMPDPAYFVYVNAAVLSGAEPVKLDCRRESGFLPDLDRLDPALLDRTALFYLCSPSNPQGSIASPTYLARLIALAQTHDFVLVLDETYAEIYDRDPPPGGLEVVRDTAARQAVTTDSAMRNVLVSHSLSKRSSAAGLRVGFVAGDPDLIAAFGRVRASTAPVIPVPLAHAAAALWRDDVHARANRDAYRARFDAAERHLSNRAGFYRPPGGFFLWLEVDDGKTVARRLWSKAAIRAMPGAFLSDNRVDGSNPADHYLRVAIVHSPAMVEEAARRMAPLL